MKSLFTKTTIKAPKKVYDFSEPVKRWLLSHGFERCMSTPLNDEPIGYRNVHMPLRIYGTDTENYRLSITDYIYGKGEMNETLKDFTTMKDNILKALDMAESFINFVEGE